MKNRIIARLRKQAHVLNDIPSVVTNCFLDCMSELLDYNKVLNYIKQNNLSLKKFQDRKNYQEMVLTNCFVQEGGIGMILEDLNRNYTELDLEWDDETDDVVQDIIEEYSEYTTNEMTTFMSDVIYDVLDAA